VPCYRPLKAYRAHGGSVVFDSKRGFADRPLELPCGQCIGCRIERSRQWAIRCIHESQMHQTSSFITLTYDNEHLPKDGSLHTEDWQKFAKRLRKRIGKFRYFMAGEYGESSSRPHYHACLFGQNFSEDRIPLKQSGKNALYQSPLLEHTWGKGFCTVGNLSFESAAYVARYAVKKITGDQAEEHYQRVDTETGEVFQVKPEFATMSRRPGIGSTWYKKYGTDVYPSDEVIHDGKRYRPPRFYDEKLPGDQLLDLKKQRLKNVRKRKEDLTPERMKTKEKIIQKQMNEQKRKN